MVQDLKDNWIKSCVRTYRWTPHYCKRLYLDDADVLGLKYWHNDARELHPEEKES